MAKDLVRTRRYVSKFYTMKTQLQAISLRIQGMRSNQQMAEAMKGATRVSRSSSFHSSFVWRSWDDPSRPVVLRLSLRKGTD
jgi:hypothetical protein